MTRPHYSNWYGTARWQKLRLHQLQSEPLCQMCFDNGEIVAATIADHIIPHRGDEELFWRGELQSLCKHCHDSIKQSQEKVARTKPLIGNDGYPVEHSIEYPSIPYGQKPAVIPTYLICGAPASGKSTYVNNNITLDSLVICGDTIASELFNIPRAKDLKADEWSQIATRKRELIKMLGTNEAKRYDKAYIIGTMANQDERKTFAHKVGITQVIIIKPTQATCIKQAMQDIDKGDVRDEGSIKAIGRWFKNFKKNPNDLILTGEGV